MTNESDAVFDDESGSDDLDTEFADLDFAPAVYDSVDDSDPAADEAPTTSTSTRPGVTAKPARRRGLRGKLASGLVLLVALGAMGGAYAVFAGSSSAASDTTSSDVEAGRQLYSVACISCHGANLQGVTNKGVSLVGVGSAAAYFQVSTGRMPVPAQGPEIARKTSKYTDAQVRQIAAYIESNGGGPAIPTGNLTSGDLGTGGELLRLNCATCHGFAGKGAPLSAGKYAPSLNDSTDLQLWTAMLSGPESMPVFNNNQITPQEKAEIVSYIQTLKAQKDPGGAGLDRIGPVSEGLVIWVIGIGVLLIAIVFIGRKA